MRIVQLTLVTSNTPSRKVEKARKPHLHTAIARHELVLELRVPHLERGQVVQQVLVHDSELACGDK